MLLHIAARQHDRVGRFMPPPCEQMKLVLQMSYNLQIEKKKTWFKNTKTPSNERILFWKNK